MGYAMRTNQYRLVLWKDQRHPDQKPIYVELYDHHTDPADTKNISEQESDLVSKLITQFEEEWTAYHVAGIID